MDQYRQEVLLTNLESRRREVMDYAINIENFRLAIQQIENDPDMADFKAHLEQLLTEHIREHKKSSVLLNVLEVQCKDFPQPQI